MTATIPLLPILAVFALSWSLTWIISRTGHIHGRLTMDEVTGIQKVHDKPTPRVGGIGIMAGLITSLLFLSDASLSLWQLILLSMVPAFLAGIVEDITRNVAPKWRLLATALGGLSFFLLTGYGIDRLGWGPLDIIGELPILMALLTMFAFAATANATNLVDGFNGLASASIIFMALGLAAISYRVDDTTIMELCLFSAAATAGFFLVNYPRGPIFLGDGGAYMLGSLMAALGIALIFRNDGVSPWALLVCFAYPAIETGFSIYRRAKRKGPRKRKISAPDNIHFHMLVYRAFARPIARQMGRKDLANPLTLYFIWPLAMTGPLVSALFFHRTLAAMVGLVVVLVLYLSIYRVVSLQHIHKRRKIPPHGKP